jgi:hypothetical protein
LAGMRRTTLSPPHVQGSWTALRLRYGVLTGEFRIVDDCG